MRRAHKWLFAILCFPAAFTMAQENKPNYEWDKISYNIQTDIVASTGQHAPFWLVSNRHGLSSLEKNNANLSIGLFRDFDKKQGFTWAYGAEFAGAYSYYSPFYIQQLYADVKYNCWELSIGSKERWSEGKHRTLSGGGLTFSPNARPIPQVRFGINEYTTVPWWFNGWVQVKGHFSYGKQTDNAFMKAWAQDGITLTRYIQDVLFHEKTAFMRIASPSGKGLGFEGGLEMYTQFGGMVYKKGVDGTFALEYGLPATYIEYIKAFIPMAGGEDAPEAEKLNINGNVLGSWHFITDYTTDNWKLRAYYEHYFEDHSQMLGVSWVPDRNGVTRFLSYHPWQDGLWGLELTLPKGKWIRGIVAEYITSRDQSGPILHNSNINFKEQISGWDYYYNHTYYQSWQHWGMAMCNPHFLSPSYNNNSSMAMPYTRLRSYHIGTEGKPSKAWEYRIMGSYTHHWGSVTDPLENPSGVTSVLLEIAYTPTRCEDWKFTGAIASDYSQLIGNNTGGMITIKKTGFLTK